MKKLIAQKQLKRANDHLDAAASILEGIGLTTQSDLLDKAGDSIDTVLDTLEAL